MTFSQRKHVPGRKDVNKAFAKKDNLLRLRDIYVKLNNSNGYHFGDLSALFYNLTDDERKAWDGEIAAFYPPDVQRELKRVIEAALFHKDEYGNDAPIPIEFGWSSSPPHGPKHSIRTTYNVDTPHYHIQLIGFPSPPASELSKRRQQKELQADDEYEES
jgi:hypothetical protein